MSETAAQGGHDPIDDVMAEGMRAADGGADIERYRMLLKAGQEAVIRHVESNSMFGYTLQQMDTDAFFNLREWLRGAIEEHGAKSTGSGIGMGKADITFDLDGMPYEVTIRPLPYKVPLPSPPERTPT